MLNTVKDLTHKLCIPEPKQYNWPANIEEIEMYSNNYYLC